MSQAYPKIGTRVSFVRTNAAGAIEQGSGIVLGITLDPNKRLMAHVDVGTEKVNVDFGALNPSGEYIELFAAAIAKVKTISDEGNTKIKDIVTEYNQKVDGVYNDLLGAPVVFDTDLAQDEHQAVS